MIANFAARESHASHRELAQRKAPRQIIAEAIRARESDAARSADDAGTERTCGEWVGAVQRFASPKGGRARHLEAGRG